MVGDDETRDSARPTHEALAEAVFAAVLARKRVRCGSVEVRKCGSVEVWKCGGPHCATIESVSRAFALTLPLGWE